MERGELDQSMSRSASTWESMFVKTAVGSLLSRQTSCMQSGRTACSMVAIRAPTLARFRLMSSLHTCRQEVTKCKIRVPRPHTAHTSSTTLETLRELLQHLLRYGSPVKSATEPLCSAVTCQV